VTTAELFPAALRAVPRFEPRPEPIVLDEADLETLELLAETPAVEAAETLPSDQRAVLARHVDGESYAEIAQRLSCSESVVRQRVSRGLRTLRTRLESGQ
jgi:RNA polymerase sigma-70 factor (ECF subfamily)